MGADLIGYMVKGPGELEFDKDRATAFFNERATDGVMRYCADPGYDDDERYMEEISLEEFLKQAESFVGEWNSGMGYRDVCARGFKDGSQVFFAGDQTWGDEPEGDGYQILKTADALGLFTFYGLE